MVVLTQQLVNYMSEIAPSLAAPFGSWFYFFNFVNLFNLFDFLNSCFERIERIGWVGLQSQDDISRSWFRKLLVD